ncbi:MAG: GGDEF domain-containing protein [Clostridia bacterium]|nr:GGDEF domain-containing protein [Clostridia bacterium]NCC75649.1 GGDEF domain-containing protein [Clostridia bacterium]
MILIAIAYFGGPVSAIVAGFMAAVFRFTFNGITLTSLVSAIGVLLVSAGCGLIALTRLPVKMKSAIMLVYSLAVRSVALFLIMDSKENLIDLLLTLYLFSVIIGSGVFYFINYLVTAHQLFNQFKQESAHDYLTGLMNTRQFDSTFNQLRSQAIANNHNVSLLMIDVDNFKQVNDSHGHTMGDSVLKELGQLLLANSRTTDFVSRIGGEEFAIILEKASRAETIFVAERIRNSIAAQIFLLPDGSQLKITVSIGVAIYPDTVQDIEQLKSMADTQLYESKHTGKNKVCIDPA